MFSGREVVKSSAEKGGIACERRFDCQTKRGMAYELEVIMAKPLRNVALRTRHVTVGNDHLGMRFRVDCCGALCKCLHMMTLKYFIIRRKMLSIRQLVVARSQPSVLDIFNSKKTLNSSMNRAHLMKICRVITVAQSDICKSIYS